MNQQQANGLSRQVNALRYAVQFLTRFPVGNIENDPELAGKSVPWFPLVGLLIGVTLSLFAWCLVEVLAMPSLLAASLIVFLWVVVTGALHLDGLADCADAWMGSHSRERMLEIMQDTHTGVGAIVMLLLILLIKVSAVDVLLQYKMWEVLILTPILGRISMALVLVSFPYVRPDGLGDAMKSNILSQYVLIPVGVLSLVLVLFDFTLLLVAGIATLVAISLIYWQIMRKIGGATGDVFGATVEITEAVFLVCFAAFFLAQAR